jgi:hypothetical protein
VTTTGRPETVTNQPLDEPTSLADALKASLAATRQAPHQPGEVTAGDAARYFELDPESPPEVACPDCCEVLDLDGLIRRHGNGAAFSIGGLTLGDVVNAANQHKCSEEDDDD